MKTIETKQAEIDQIELYINDALDLVSKAITILKDKGESLNIENIISIAYTGKPDLERDKQLLTILENTGLTKELLIEAGYDTQRMYVKASYNKVKHLYEVQSLLNKCNINTIYVIKNLIEIKDDKACLISNYKEVLINNFSFKCENTKQEEVTGIFNNIIKELNKLKKYNIGYYNVLNNIYEENNSLNINASYILSIK